LVPIGQRRSNAASSASVHALISLPFGLLIPKEGSPVSQPFSMA
jgi:hypothetical protein